MRIFSAKCLLGLPRGCLLSVIVINSNSSGFNKAKEEGILKLSETIYHELKAHVEPKINPTRFENGVLHEQSQKQEHFNCHGNYSEISPSPENAKEGTPHREYLDQGKKAIKNVGEYLEK